MHLRRPYPNSRSLPEAGGATVRTAHSRDIVFLDLIVGADPATAPARSLEDLLHRLDGMRQAGEAFQWRSNRQRKVMIRDLDLRPDRGVACLLLYATNLDGPGASFSDVETNQQRDVEKLQNEGRPDSAHLLIDYRQQAGRPHHRYTALLEESSTLNRGCVESLLNHILRTMAKQSPDDFRFEGLDGVRDASGRPRTRSYKSMVELQGHPSSDFLAALENGGAIQGIALETRNQARYGFGECPYAKATRLDVRLSPATTWRDVGVTAFNTILGRARLGGYEAARISFRTGDRVPRTVTIDTETGNVLGDGFVKKQRVGPLQTVLLEASSEFETQIVAAMDRLLDDHQEGSSTIAA
jgi:hypothetical protein